MDKLAGGCLLPLEQPEHEGAIGCADPCFTYWLPVPSACLPHVPEAQGSLPIVALLLYARGDGSLTYVPSLSTGASRATREEPTPSEAQRVICALALGTVELAPRPGKRQLAPPSYWIGV